MKLIAYALLIVVTGLSGVLMSLHVQNIQMTEAEAAANAQPFQRVPIRSSTTARQQEIVNDAIDMEGFLRLSQEAAAHRASRRVSEEEFIRMSREPTTIILDARSREMFDLMHVAGAINLSFPDISIASLEETIPDKSTRVLIYCNNNFRNEEMAFASKLAPASLNLSTYVSLFTYGYENVYELGSRKDPKDSLLTFISTSDQGA